jgi:hypothetical protein
VIATLESGAFSLPRIRSTTDHLPKLTRDGSDTNNGACRRMNAALTPVQLRPISDENDEDTLNAFAYDTYTIVGLTNSTTYLNMERGTTKLAGGKITAYVYLPEGGFSTDYYTELYVRLSDATGKIFSDAYDDAVANMEDPLKERMELLTNARYQDIVNKAQNEIPMHRESIKTAR